MLGELIPDIKQAILLVCNEGKEEEAITRMSRIGYDNCIGYLNGGFKTWLASNKEVDQAKRITAKELEILMSNEAPLIIDVRKQSEFSSEHIEGAVNIPLHLINNHLEEFPKDKPFILHCAGGYRSMIAASILKQRGFDNFEDVIGGFKEIAATSIKKSNYVCPTTLL